MTRLTGQLRRSKLTGEVFKALETPRAAFVAVYAFTTNAEIWKAYQDGEVILCHDTGTNNIFPLTNVTETRACFSGYAPGSSSLVTWVCEEDAWSAGATSTVDHANNKANPHGVTAAQVGARPASWTPTAAEVGLGNVPNLATNDLTPTYTEAPESVALTSGEKLSVAFGKIAKAITDLLSHIGNNVNPHGVTAAQVGARPTSWTPTAAEVGARADDWLPTIAELGAAPSGYGLGGNGVWINDLNLADKCGYYSWTSTAQNIPFAYGNMFVIRRGDGRITQIGIDPYMEGHGGIVIRHYTTKQWTPWEWVNPPMSPGEEYCTTERVASSRVYVRRISAGALANKGTIKCALTSGISVVELSGYALSSSGGYYPLPLLNYSTGAVRAMMRKVNNDIEIVTFDDCSAYTAYVEVKYTKG